MTLKLSSILDGNFDKYIKAYESQNLNKKTF